MLIALKICSKNAKGYINVSVHDCVVYNFHSLWQQSAVPCSHDNTTLLRISSKLVPCCSTMESATSRSQVARWCQSAEPRHKLPSCGREPRTVSTPSTPTALCTISRKWKLYTVGQKTAMWVKEAPQSLTANFAKYWLIFGRPFVKRFALH